ncbi:MAG: riboflavin synthase [Acidimicrobiales bacterium]|nr:riboflavin synthase [Acidimicrobiales bacterium]
MFTGIVEELGTFLERRGERSRFSGSVVLDGAGLGDSIAVNGCCLTLVEQGAGWWEADLSDETLARTCLGALVPGDVVNLERPLRADGRLGGHVVLGHVDAVGAIAAVPPDLAVTIPLALSRYCVEKGSVTIDGVSLTIVSVTDRPQDGVSVLRFAIIPHTAAVTTLGHKAVGAPVDVEVDILAKHVEKLLSPYAPGGTPPADGGG